MCRCTAKIVLILLSLAFWAVAGFLFFVGITVFLEYQHYEELDEAWYTLLPAIILFGVGMLFGIVGIVGLVGACKEQRCLLGVFCTILIIIFVGLVASAVLAYIYKKPVIDGIENGMDNLLNDYGHNESKTMTDQMDYIQQKLQCCGKHNYTDWEHTWWYTHQGGHLHYPDSCCPSTKSGANSSTSASQHCGDDKVFKDGCLDLVKSVFLNHMIVAASSAVGVLAILAVGIIFACILMSKKQEEFVAYVVLPNDVVRA